MTPLVLGMMLATPIASATKASETCMMTKSWEAQEQGWKLRAMETAQLSQGEFQTLKTVLFSTREYVIKTCADAGVSMLELVVYDANGNELARASNGSGKTPELAMDVNTASSVYVVGQVRKGAAGAHGVSIGVFYK